MSQTTTSAPLRLGKLPARPGAVTMKFTTYVKETLLPTPPTEFGHDHGVGHWKMLGNDTVGDCVIAGGLHETMLWSHYGSATAPTDKAAAIANYSAITGYDPDDPSTDKGTDVADAASYRRHTGLVDADGARHRIVAYLALTPGDIGQHLQALYLFGAVGIGLEFPDSAMTQFHNHQPWDVVPGAKIEGGHYVSAVARRDDRFVVVTWGREQPMTDAFFQKYNDESYVYVSSEYLKDGHDPEGFDLAQLQADLAKLRAV